MSEKRGSNLPLFVVVIFLVVVLIATDTIITGFFNGSVANSGLAYPHGVGVFKAPNGEYIGISDGTFIFDSGTDRLDTNLKQEAVMALKSNDIASAISLWQSAIELDPTDAEAGIYLEDQRILLSGKPFITLVVGTTFAQPLPSYSSRDILQGAYIEQKEFNARNSFQVRLLIAKSGSESVYAITIAMQIVQAAKLDSTILGVMGWPSTSRTLNIIQDLTNARIPIVSQTASGDALTGISPYFFRIAPPNGIQGVIGAKYAGKVLKANRAVLFIDQSDNYSQSLAQDFKQQFTADGHSIVHIEYYKTGIVSNFAELLNDALNYHANLIYFPSSSASDIAKFMKTLPTAGQFSKLPVMCGDTAYIVANYPQKQLNIANHLYFTAFAHPDEWKFLGLQAQVPDFFKVYARTFDPRNQYENIYGYSRPDSTTILSYDAVLTLLVGYQMALKTQKAKNITPVDLQVALTEIRGSKAIQGVGGQISFDSRHDSTRKVIVILDLDPAGYVKVQSLEGCFLLTCAP